MSKITSPIKPHELKALRAEHNLSKDELAEKLGMPGRNRKDTIKDLENGKRSITFGLTNSLIKLKLYKPKKGKHKKPKIHERRQYDPQDD